MSHPHNLHELQEGIGQTGKLGELFIGLGGLIAVLGLTLFVIGEMHMLSDGFSPDGGNVDAVTVGFLFLFEGIGFVVFGVMIVLAGWGRHHEGKSDW
ncbi:MAG: hypothetical protein V4510_11645 [bacterium]